MEVYPQAGDITISTPSRILSGHETSPRKVPKTTRYAFLFHDKLLIGLEGLFVPAWDAAIPLIKCEDTYLASFSHGKVR